MQYYNLSDNIFGIYLFWFGTISEMQYDVCLMEIIKHKDSSRPAIIGPTNPIGADIRSELWILSSGVCRQCYINSKLQLHKNHCARNDIQRP